MEQTQQKKSTRILPCLGAAVLFVCFTTINAWAGTMAVPETLNLNMQVNHSDIEGLPKDVKSVNNFSHAKHANQYLKGNSAYAATPFKDDFTCAACHLGSESRESITGSNPRERIMAALNAEGGPQKLKSYFHGICRTCHNNMKKAGIATGPSKCSGCHSRK